MAIIEVAIKPGDVPGMFRVDVVRSPAGEASATVELDVDGLLAKRQRLQETVPASAGTFPTTGGLFIGLVTGVVVIVGGLTFFPALALGPIVEQLAMRANTLF